MTETLTNIMHVDMDAFFVQLELNRYPDLRGKPVVVGSHGSRGVVAAASYEARAYGVFSATPSTLARRLCPDLIFLSGNLDLYAAVSKKIMEVLLSFTPDVEQISIDEAFLDVRGCQKIFGSPLEMAKLIRESIREKENVLCSIGVATNKMIAKLASKAAKPTPSMDGTKPGQGVVLVEAGEELDFLHPMPVGALWGVGPATEKVVRKLGAETVGDLAAMPVATLVGALGKSHGTHIAQLARGIDSNTIAEKQEAKSMSHEMTFLEDRNTHEEIRKAIWVLSEKVGTRLRAAEKYTRHVGIRVRHGDFTSYTTGIKLPTPTQSTQVIAAEAMALLDKHDVSMGVRLVGVKVSDLSDDGSSQMSFGDLSGDSRFAGAGTGATGRGKAGGGKAGRAKSGRKAEARETAGGKRAAAAAGGGKAVGKLDRVVDAIRNRYGSKSIRRAVVATEKTSSGVGFAPLASLKENRTGKDPTSDNLDDDLSNYDLLDDDLSGGDDMGDIDLADDGLSNYLNSDDLSNYDLLDDDLSGGDGLGDIDLADDGVDLSGWDDDDLSGGAGKVDLADDDLSGWDGLGEVDLVDDAVDLSDDEVDLSSDDLDDDEW